MILLNVDAENGDGFGMVPLEVAKVVPAFTNNELEEVSVVPNVLFVLATAAPNPVPANELVFVESNCCELGVTNGPLIAADGAPNGVLLVDMVSVFCTPKTLGADTVVPKVLLLDC